MWSVLAVFVLIKYTLLHVCVKKGVIRKVVKLKRSESCDDPAFLGEFSPWSLTVPDRLLTPEKMNSSLYCRELHHARGMNMLTRSFLQELNNLLDILGENCGGSEGKYWDYKTPSACFSVKHHTNVYVHAHAEMVIYCWNTMDFELSLLANCQCNFQCCFF